MATRQAHGAPFSVIALETGYVNVAILRGPAGAVIIDTGYAEDAGSLAAAIEARGVTPSEVKAVIVTHGHADHAGGARAIADRFGAPVWAGTGDRDLLASGANVAAHQPPLCPRGAVARFRVAEDSAATYAPTSVDVWVDRQRSLKALLGAPAQVIPLAGHTNGALVVVAGPFAFVGDLFRGCILGSCAATHLYMCDLDDNRRDIEAVLFRHAPTAIRFFTGHFGPVSRGAVVRLARSMRTQERTPRP